MQEAFMPLRTNELYYYNNIDRPEVASECIHNTNINLHFQGLEYLTYEQLNTYFLLRKKQKKSTEEIHNVLLLMFGLMRSSDIFCSCLNDTDISSDVSLLTYSSKFGYLTLVKYLVNQGVPIDSQAVIGASRKGYYNTVAYLIRHANKTDRNHMFCYSIYAAAILGHNKLLKLLVEKGYEYVINEKFDYFGTSAEHASYLEELGILGEILASLK